MLSGGRPTCGRRRHAHGARDGLAVQLGDIQTVLADVMLVPGGALLPEIALRARFDRYESTSGDAGERVCATHAVERAELSAGLDRLLVPDAGRSDLPTSNAVDSSWLFCPGLRGGRHQFDWVGGVTWDHLGVATSAAPWLDARESDHAQTRRATAGLVCGHVLAGYPEQLVDAPADLVERCVEEPETIRAWVG